VAGLALLVRLLALLELRGSVWNEVLLGDARHFLEWGERIAAGDWLGSEVFYQAPLYPYLLGLLTRLFDSAQLPVQLLQIGLAALAAGVLTRATGRAFAPLAGRVAGTLLALYGPAIAYDLQVEKTSLAVSLSALLAAWLLESAPSTRRTFGAGVTLGALVLLRENALVLLVPLALASLAGAPGRARRLTALLGGVALWLVPVGLRNQALGGVFLPTTSNAGVNFFIGNGPDADGLYQPLVAGRGHPDHEREDATRLARELSGRALAPHEVSAFWFARSRQGIAADPARFLALLGRKALLLCNVTEIMDAVAFEVFQDESRVLRLLSWFSFALVLPLALVGSWLARARPGARRLALAAGLLGLSVVAFFVVARFRLGLVPFLLPLAGLGVSAARASAQKGAALGVFLATALVCLWPLDLPGDPRATSHANLASELLRRGDLVGAEQAAARATELDPVSPEAAFNHGLALRHLRREREALAPFERAAALEPSYEADCLAEIGAIRAALGDPDGAREALTRALQRRPGHPEAERYLQALDAR